MKAKLSIIFVMLSFFAMAQKDEPTTWKNTASKKEVQEGTTVELVFTADIKEGWYLYSSDFDKDLGPVVAEFNFTPDESYELVGKIKPVGAKSKFDEVVWNGTYTYFTKKAEFRQTVKILKDNPQIKVKLNGQACNDESGKCVPVIKQFNFTDIKVVKKAEGTDKPKMGKDNKTGSQIPAIDSGNSKVLNEKDFPNRLEYLKAEKAQLVNTSSGKDEALSQLKDFVKKYGN